MRRGRRSPRWRSLRDWEATWRLVIPAGGFREPVGPRGLTRAGSSSSQVRPDRTVQHYAVDPRFKHQPIIRHEDQQQQAKAQPVQASVPQRVAEITDVRQKERADPGDEELLPPASVRKKPIAHHRPMRDQIGLGVGLTTRRHGQVARATHCHFRSRNRSAHGALALVCSTVAVPHSAGSRRLSLGMSSTTLALKLWLWR